MPSAETIVCLATISWDYLWQRHQEFMVRFARAGNRVLFVEPIGIRMPKWEDRHRIVARVRNRQRAGTRGVRQIEPNLWVLDPLVNPFQQFGFVHRRNVAALTRQLQRGLAEIGGGQPVAWTYVPTPLARQAIARLAPRLVVYDCVDAYSENPKGVFAWYAESERALVRQADLVLVTSPRLYEHWQPLNAHTFYAPPGVHYERFADDTLPEPAILQGIPGPRLGFFGGIDERVNLELLTCIARQHREWHLILMGIARTDISALQKLANVHFLGYVPHTDLPAYLRHMEVLLLPYVQTVFTQYIQPAKLFECLASGRPTVGLGLPLFEAYRDVLFVAHTPADFVNQVHAALGDGAAGARADRQRARARANTWDARFGEINAQLDARLAL